MRRSNLILVVGVSLAASISGGAYLLSDFRMRATAKLEMRCRDENAKVLQRSADAFLDRDKPWKYDPLVCDRHELKNDAGAKLVGLQAEIVAAHDATFDPRPWFYASLYLSAASAVPWVWYFLLRRVAEVKAAVSGNPPEK